MPAIASTCPFAKYLSGYPQSLIEQAQTLSQHGKLQEILNKKYPSSHEVRTDKALYFFVHDVKSIYMRKSEPLSKVVFDSNLHVVHHALGTNSTILRTQGNKLKSRKEIRIASVFKQLPVDFLHMITVHELAHLKEKQHDKAFYQLCTHMLTNYHQLEFDLRCWLALLELE